MSIHTVIRQPDGVATVVTSEAVSRAVSASGAATQVAVTTVTTGIRGAPGVAGSDGGATQTAHADVAIGGHRVICVDDGLTMYADCTQIAHALTVMGMSIAAVSAGDDVPFVRSGAVTEPSWSWTLDQPVYLGVNGTLTQVLPGNAAFSLVVGFPVTATKLFVSIREPIVLS